MEFDRRGDMVRVTRVGDTRVGDVGQPASLPREKRTGSKTVRARRKKSRRPRDEPRRVGVGDPKARIDDEGPDYIR